MAIVFKYTVAWIGLVVLAIINGAIREKGYGARIGELHAHQLSTLIGLALFSVYAWILSGFWRIESARQAFAIGGIWLVLTVAFEFLFGHYVAGHSWGRLLHDYNLLRGRVWILILIWAILAPYVCHLMRA